MPTLFALGLPPVPTSHETPCFLFDLLGCRRLGSVDVDAGARFRIGWGNSYSGEAFYPWWSGEILLR